MQADPKTEPKNHGSLSAAILVLNWNGRSLLQTCLPLLLNQTYENYAVVVIDNGSTDASAAYVTEKFPQVRLIQNEDNLGFSRGINAGLRLVSADVVVLLNNDVLVQPNWLAELLRPFAEAPQIGIVGCQLRYPDGTIQHAGAELTYPLAFSHHFHHKEAEVDSLPAWQDVPYVTGAAMAIHRTVLNKIGLLDEMFHPFYYEEVDYCYRARAAGFRVLLASQAVAVHNESSSIKKVQHLKLKTLHQNRYRFVLKHYTFEQFMGEFVPAETARLNQNHLFADVDAIRLACLETAVTAPSLFPDSKPEEMRAVQKALLRLRKTAVTATASQSQAAPPPALQEFAFPQTGSPFRSLIALFRRRWSSIAAKWLVRSLLQQQELHNRYLQRQIAQLSTQAHSQSLEIELLLELLWPTQETQKQLQADLTSIGKRLEEFPWESKQQS